MSSVRKTWRLWVSLVLAAASGLSAAAKQTDAAGRADYSAFKVIAERNIFNPNRSSRAARQAKARPPRVESFALTGTLSYEKGTFAFFDGTSSAYRKVLKRDGTIAGYKVTEISPEAAKLEANGRQIELRVGTQLRREDKGEWEVAAQPVTYASASSHKSTSSSRTSRSSKADNLPEPPSKHKHPGGPDSGQYSKKERKEMNAFLKAEKEFYPKGEMNDFSKEALKGYSKEDVKDVKDGLKKLMEQ